MKKLLVVLVLMLSSCSSASAYSEDEASLLKSYGVYEKASKDCGNKVLVSEMLRTDFNSSYIDSYCSLGSVNASILNTLLDHGVSAEDITTFSTIPYVRVDRIERYLAYEKDIETSVLEVNMDMDLEPYSTTHIISDDSDMTMLINKFNSLPEGYIPPDLVDVKSVCTLGVDYSCTTMEKVQLRKEAAEAYEEFVSAAKENGLDIVAIACYRDYAYQSSLYNYNKGLYGQEHADQYYARPGQSEHNSALAVDITFNGYNFNEIENYEGYDWILEHMSEFGFILRYPEDKQDETRFGYESWHLRYVGKEAASTIHENGWTLEEYHAKK